MNSDFSYRSDGMFVTLLANNSKAGNALSEFMILNPLGNAVLRQQFPLIEAQLKKAGYTIAKELPGKMSDDELLNQLFS